MNFDIESFAVDVRAAVAGIHTVVVDGFPSNGTEAITVILDVQEMLRLIAVVKPKLLYLHEDWFDFASLTNDLSVELGANDGDEIDISPLSALKTYGNQYDGKLCLVYVGFMFDNVLHLSFEEAEWYMTFQSDAAHLLERLKTVLAENRRALNVKSAAEVKRKAAALAIDPAFNFNRPSKEKRTFLAQDLFPGCDWLEISQIVDEATNIDFLNKARSSDC